jgi:RNA polymerase sigma-70 factor (ECF subfamily)
MYADRSDKTMPSSLHEVAEFGLSPRSANRSQPWGRAVPDEGCKSGEAVLISQLRAGDRLAIERFVREHTGWLLALALRYVRDGASAEDCVQEAFLQAFRNIRKFEARSALKSWLFRIVVNAALMKLRCRRGALEHPLHEVLPQIECHRSEPAATWTEMATPEQILERKEARELVAQKMMELPDGYRIVLLLRDIEGLSTEETARLLATTEGAVKVRLHRARAAFRELIAPALRHYV